MLPPQRAFFLGNHTLPLSFRLAALERLRSAIVSHEDEINAALRADLGKSPTESYMCEVGMTLSELSYRTKAPEALGRPTGCVPTPLAQFHAKSLRRAAALRRSAHHVALELSLYAHAGAADRRDRRGQLLRGKALRLLSGHLSRDP